MGHEDYASWSKGQRAESVETLPHVRFTGKQADHDEAVVRQIVEISGVDERRRDRAAPAPDRPARQRMEPGAPRSSRHPACGTSIVLPTTLLATCARFDRTRSRICCRTDAPASSNAGSATCTGVADRQVRVGNHIQRIECGTRRRRRDPSPGSSPVRLRKADEFRKPVQRGTSARLECQASRTCVASAARG